MALFAYLIIRTFQLVFSAGNSVFLSQQIRRNSVSACFFSEANGPIISPPYKYDINILTHICAWSKIIIGLGTVTGAYNAACFVFAGAAKSRSTRFRSKKKLMSCVQPKNFSE